MFTILFTFDDPEKQVHIRISKFRLLDPYIALYMLLLYQQDFR